MKNSLLAIVLAAATMPLTFAAKGPQTAQTPASNPPAATTPAGKTKVKKSHVKKAHVKKNKKTPANSTTTGMSK